VPLVCCCRPHKPDGCKRWGTSILLGPAALRQVFFTVVERTDYSSVFVIRFCLDPFPAALSRALSFCEVPLGFAGTIDLLTSHVSLPSDLRSKRRSVFLETGCWPLRGTKRFFCSKPVAGRLKKRSIFLRQLSAAKRFFKRHEVIICDCCAPNRASSSLDLPQET
jgi:hypothetical protein